MDGLSLASAPGGADTNVILLNAGGGASAGAWPSANQAIFCLFRVGRARVITGVRVFNGAPSGNAKSGLYSSDGTTITQMSLSASIALSGSSDGQDLAFAAPQNVVPFVDYMAMLVLDNATATLLRQTYVSGAIVIDMQKAYGFNNGFTAPPTSELVSNLVGPSSGYSPILGVY